MTGFAMNKTRLTTLIGPFHMQQCYTNNVKSPTQGLISQKHLQNCRCLQQLAFLRVN